MGKYLIEDTTLTAISDAIRGKTGGTEKIKPGDWVVELDKVQPMPKYLWERKTQKTTTTTTTLTLTGTRSDYAQEVYITVSPTATITAADIAGFVLTDTSNSVITLTLASGGIAYISAWGSISFETEWEYYPQYGCVALYNGDASGSFKGTKTVQRTNNTTTMVSDGYVLSDDINAYPTDGSQHTDGYYYTLIAEAE